MWLLFFQLFRFISTVLILPSTSASFLYLNNLKLTGEITSISLIQISSLPFLPMIGQVFPVQWAILNCKLILLKLITIFFQGFAGLIITVFHKYLVDSHIVKRWGKKIQVLNFLFSSIIKRKSNCDFAKKTPINIMTANLNLGIILCLAYHCHVSNNLPMR